MTAVIRGALFALSFVGLFLGLPSDLSAGSQQREKVWNIGLLHVGLDHVPPSLKALQDELKRLGLKVRNDDSPDGFTGVWVLQQNAQAVHRIDLAHSRAACEEQG